MWTCFGASVYNLLAITCEQYCEVVHPHLHKARLLHLRPAWVACVIWAVSFTFHVTFSVPDTDIKHAQCQAWGIFTNEVTSAVAGLALKIYIYIFPAATMLVRNPRSCYY